MRFNIYWLFLSLAVVGSVLGISLVRSQMLREDRVKTRGIHHASSALQLISLCRVWEASDDAQEFDAYLRNEALFMIETILKHHESIDNAELSHQNGSIELIQELCSFLGCKSLAEFRQIVERDFEDSPLNDETTPESRKAKEILKAVFRHE